MDLPWGLKLAQKVFRKDIHRKKVTAAYIEGGTIIIGSNSKRTDPAARLFGHRGDRTHAELSVLKNITDGSKGKLYIYRERMDGAFGNSRPCQFCMQMLISKNIRNIIYTTDNGIAKERIGY